MIQIIKPIKDVWHITVGYKSLARWYRGGLHLGIDLRTRTKEHPSGIGTPIYAAADGEWYQSYYDSKMGNKIVIKHRDGYETVYSHLSKSYFKSGYKNVKMGDIIGRSGNTGRISFGPHLHFELNKDGKSLNPLDGIRAGNNFLDWARARSIMQVEGKGRINLVSKDKILEINQNNCWEILKENTWGISEKDYHILEKLILNK